MLLRGIVKLVGMVKVMAISAKIFAHAIGIDVFNLHQQPSKKTYTGLLF